MSFFSKRTCIKLPKQITVLYNQKENQVMFLGPLGFKLLLLKLKLLFVKECRYIYVVNLLKHNQGKKLKSLGGTLKALLKRTFLELCFKHHKTLRLFGVGFKVFSFDLNNTKVLQFKLGFSHFIFYKVPKHVDLVTLKNTKIYVKTSSLNEVTQISATIRALKFPEIYKGKGILYNKEVVKLKKGKKTT